MVDTLKPEQRRLCMSRNKRRDTGLELRLRQALWRAGCRYRLKSNLLGKPDIVFPAKKLAVFVDGCFWHCCPEHGEIPASNRDFWKAKLEKTQRRDGQVNKGLLEAGWSVKRFWEHDVAKNMQACVDSVRQALREKDS